MNKRIILWGGLIVIMAIIVTVIIQIADDEENIEPIRTTETSEYSEILNVKEEDWTKGNPDANVIIIKYSDFQCPSCRFFAGWDNMLSDEYAEDVLFVSRYFPLRSFQHSLLAAKYAEAAGRQGHYWEMHDLIYINQRNWAGNYAETFFSQYAESLDLDIAQFNEDLQDPEIEERIETDFGNGVQLRIQGVPSIFINGKQISLPNSLDAYRNLIESYM